MAERSTDMETEVEQPDLSRFILSPQRGVTKKPLKESALRTRPRTRHEDKILYRCQVMFTKDQYEAVAAAMGLAKESTFLRDVILTALGYYDQTTE